MGQVHLAQDTLLERPVAIKFVAAYRISAKARLRFLREARAAASINHPNVASVFRVGQLEERPYLVTEYVPGTSMDRLPLPLPPEEALSLGLGVARGLAAAHRRGILHRDVKPANVIVAADGTPKLVDFGLAKLGDGASDTSSSEDSGGFSPARCPPTTAGSATMDLDDDRTIPPDELEGDPNADLRRLTRPGALMGTPDYMAPELWLGQPATLRSDVYALGALLFELFVGRPPFFEIPVAEMGQAIQHEPAPPLPEHLPEVAALVARCLRTEADERFGSADEVREAIERLRPRGGVSPRPEGNPYRGLGVFDARHQDTFFGRAADIEAILERLRGEAVVFVAGDSGIGKSSVCRAGVLPALAREGLEGCSTWAQVTLTPGLRPLRSLAAALSGFAAEDAEALAARLFDDPASVLASVRRQNGSRGLVILVDQLEELLTVSDVEEARAFERWIAEIAAGQAGLRLMATVRADFLSRVSRLDQLGPLLGRSIYLLRPLSGDELRAVVVGPAASVGTRFEDDAMVDELVRGASGAPGALPLLQFTLARLWELRNPVTGVIQRAALDRLGGLSGALGQHADHVLDGLRPGARKEARQVLLQLVTDEGTRAVRTNEELRTDLPKRAEVVEALVRGRLLVALEGTQGSAYQLAHEVLIASWGTLRAWLTEDADAQLARARLRRAAQEWSRQGRPSDALWSVRLLKLNLRILDDELSDEEARFVTASRRAARRRSALRTVAMTLVPTVVVAVWGAATCSAEYRSSQRVKTLLTKAESSADLGRGESARARQLRERMTRAFTSHRRPEGEMLWGEVQSLERNADAAHREALVALEAALSMHPGRPALRHRFADAVFERLTLAERRRRFELKDELLSRLAVYDESGERRARLFARATVDFVGLHEARVLVRRYHRKGGRRIPVEVGTVEGSSIGLAPGSYLFRFDWPSGQSVQLPLRLCPSEHVRIEGGAIRPPPHVPPGYIYIPAGETLFGSGERDSGRLGFFDSPPLHPVEVPAFLIAQREVTFESYLEFLEAVPVRERKALLPGTQGSGTGTMHLHRDDPGRAWVLRFRPLDVTHTARSGEPVVYPQRNERKRQDWLQWPVLGVSAEQAIRYARWLDRSARVPGARLCTEHEWVRAARGADERTFPHGDVLLPADANFDATYERKPGGMGPDEVGSHPASRSPFGVDDMTGNAFEWTTSSLEPNQLVLRGGSYFYDRKTNRLCNRQVAASSVRLASSGIRICASLNGGEREP